MIEIEKNFYIARSRVKNKKYSIFIKEDGKYKYLLSFGDKRYQHYKDTTPERLYKNLDHNDPERRRLYYARHGKTNNKYSAKYWSNNYLW